MEQQVSDLVVQHMKSLPSVVAEGYEMDKQLVAEHSMRFGRLVSIATGHIALERIDHVDHILVDIADLDELGRIVLERIVLEDTGLVERTVLERIDFGRIDRTVALEETHYLRRHNALDHMRHHQDAVLDCSTLAAAVHFAGIDRIHRHQQLRRRHHRLQRQLHHHIHLTGHNLAGMNQLQRHFAPSSHYQG